MTQFRNCWLRFQLHDWRGWYVMFETPWWLSKDLLALTNVCERCGKTVAKTVKRQKT